MWCLFTWHGWYNTCVCGTPRVALGGRWLKRKLAVPIKSESTEHHNSRIRKYHSTLSSEWMLGQRGGCRASVVLSMPLCCCGGLRQRSSVRWTPRCFAAWCGWSSQWLTWGHGLCAASARARVQAHTSTYPHTHTPTRPQARARAHAHIRISGYPFIHSSIHPSIHPHARTHTHIYTHARTHTRARTHIHTHTRTHTATPRTASNNQRSGDEALHTGHGQATRSGRAHHILCRCHRHIRHERASSVLDRVVFELFPRPHRQHLACPGTRPPHEQRSISTPTALGLPRPSLPLCVASNATREMPRPPAPLARQSGEAHAPGDVRRNTRRAAEEEVFPSRSRRPHRIDGRRQLARNVAPDPLSSSTLQAQGARNGPSLASRTA